MRILIAAAALSMALISTANAQNRPSDHRPGYEQNRPSDNRPSDNRPGYQQNHQSDRPTARPEANRGTAHYQAPRHWKGSRASWQRHVAQCQRKFRSYNPRTDRYTVRGNRTAICRL